MSVMAHLSIFPVDKGESLSPYVARAVEIIRTSGLAYRFEPMGTIVEGELDDILAVVKKCHAALEADCRRIVTTLKLDYRKGRTNGLKTKVESVQAKVGGPI